MRNSFLLSRRDWVYLLSLVIPFIVYDLTLKVLLILAWPEDPGFLGGLDLMRSDLLFNLGFLSLWVGLFAVARGGLSRLLVVGLFHVTTILVALIETCAYQYFNVTGSTLDFDYVLLWLYSPEGTGGVIASQVTPGILVAIVGVLIYAVVGPATVTHLVSRWRGWTGAGGRRVPWLRLAGVVLTAYALFALSLLPSTASIRAGNSFSRAAVVNLVMTAAEVAEGEGLPNLSAEPIAETSPPEAHLQPTAGAEKRNVVLIFLESTRAQATTPYNQRLQTTPFLNELANQSLMAEQAYTVVPHTHNAITATNCGIEPPLDRWGTLLLGTRDDSVPSRCLPHLLKGQGYDSAYFMSQASSFENSPKIMENLGYDEFHSVESMDKEEFEQTNYFGYEDEIMLEPSKEWLTEQKKTGKPFLATYLTSAPHHEYLAPYTRHGRVNFSNDDTVNRYLNSIRNQDYFLEQLFVQYNELGLYEDTVFVLVGDHGEAFGEHGNYQHDNAIYEEGLRVPMLIHDPRQFRDGARVTVPVNQLDILPTIADLLGYEIQGGSYGGRSLLRPLPENRTLMFSCWNESGCLASLKGKEKYIYHFGDKPEEIFDLSKDPNERQSIAAERPEEVEKRRNALLQWRAKVNSMYGQQAPEEE